MWWGTNEQTCRERCYGHAPIYNFIENNQLSYNTPKQGQRGPLQRKLQISETKDRKMH